MHLKSTFVANNSVHNVVLLTPRFARRLSQLKMPLPEGPVGGMDPRDLEDNVEELEAVIGSALEHKVENSVRGEKIITQAKTILKIRRAWKNRAWNDMVSLTATSGLPRERASIQNEIVWANYEAHDRLWQESMEDALKTGQMDSTGSTSRVEYEHVVDLIKSVNR